MKNHYEQRHRERSPGGVQITIRSDGERAVNSDGFVKPRIAGKVFVDLHCPHCPGQSSITFTKYRYHLDSRNHRHKIENLAYKHSIVLRRIRRQQRAEQKEIEEKWEKEKPEEFKDVISTYCKMCKLAFKSLPDTVDEHNDSKLHKIQQRYLHPKCEMCRMSFPSRMVYEYHIASIRHLRMLSMCNKNGHDGTPEDESKEENKEEIDLTNFITMDSVGEDEEVGSEKEEITGNLEDIEKAEEDAKEGEEEDEHAEEEELAEDDDEFVMDVEDDGDLQDPEEEQFEPSEVSNISDIYKQKVSNISDIYKQKVSNISDIYKQRKDYIEPMEAVYCKLCHKAIRMDTEMGDELIDRHCSTAAHIDNLQFANSNEYMDGEEDNFEEAGENVVEGDPVVEEEEEEKRIDGEEEENPEDRQDYELEEEEEPNYEEVMVEHGEDIDLETKTSTKSRGK
ncbi:hypothetical protein Avbf_15275 [Armadillidium vulgare]|nr:hypothetical protein Avbf_15275 [Armadillidium vulgare]